MSSANSSPLVQRSFAARFIHQVQSIGHDPYPLLGRCGVPEDILDVPEGMTPEWPLYAFLDVVQRELGLPDFGLISGQAPGLDDMGHFGSTLGQCVTLHNVLELFSAKVSSLSTDAKYWTVVGDEETWFCRAGAEAMPVGERQAELYTVTVMTRIVQIAAGVNWVPSRIWLEADSSPSSGIECHYAEAEFCCSRPYTAIAFPTRLLSRALHSSALNATLERLRSELISSSGELPGIQTSADRAGCSPRTLQRDLHEHGLTYRSLLDQVRFRQAVTLLVEEQATVKTIAGELGYANHPAFVRAFRRWTGMPPTAFRRQAGEGATQASKYAAPSADPDRD